MTQLRWQTHVGFAVESSGWGVNVAAAPALFVPVTKCDFQDMLNYYYDEAYRSVQAKDFGAYGTTGTGEFNVSCDAYVDTLPVLLGVCLIGDNDVVTVTSAAVLNAGWTNVTVNAHTFTIQPKSPKSVTFFDYNGYSERYYPGGVISDCTLKYSPEGSLSTDYKGKSRLSVLVSGSFIPAIGAYAPILGWQASCFINNTQNFRLVDCQVDFKRAQEVLYTQAGTQSPTNIYAFPLEIDGTITLDFQDETEYNYYRTSNLSATFELHFVSSSNNALFVKVHQPVYTSYAVDRSKDALTAKMKFRGIYAQTMSTNVTLTVFNGVTAAY